MVTLHNTMEESSNPKDPENVKVVVRVRPLNDKEMLADYRNIIHVDSINGTVKLANLNQSRESPPKLFTFDTVFPPDVKQVSSFFKVYIHDTYILFECLKARYQVVLEF